jgi:predicted RNA-binding Zn-ribbon protein involved in translation (DUF1610 family)
MDATSIAGAYTGLKAAKDILVALFDAKVDADAKSKILEAQSRLGEVQDVLFSLREQLFQLQEDRDSLRLQLSEAQGWNATAGQYELASTPGSAVVYRFKGQPDHFACPSCFNKHQVHILQDLRKFSGLFGCTGCGSEYPVKVARSMGSIRMERG